MVLIAPAPAICSTTTEFRTAVVHAYDSAESVAFSIDNVLTSLPLAADLRKQVMDKTYNAIRSDRQ